MLQNPALIFPYKRKVRLRLQIPVNIELGEKDKEKQKRKELEKQQKKFPRLKVCPWIFLYMDFPVLVNFLLFPTFFVIVIKKCAGESFISLFVSHLSLSHSWQTSCGLILLSATMSKFFSFLLLLFYTVYDFYWLCVIWVWIMLKVLTYIWLYCIATIAKPLLL